jgi:hypothetical protein
VYEQYDYRRDHEMDLKVAGGGLQLWPALALVD